MRGEHRMELELVEQLLGSGRTHLVDELVVGAGHFVHRIDGLGVVNGVLTAVQHGDTVVLLAQIGQMEVSGEGTSQQLGLMHVRLVDDVDNLLQVVLIGIRVGQNAGETFVTGLQCMFAHFIELGQQVFIELTEHLAKNLQTQIHFLFEGCGKITLLRTLGAGAGRDDSRVRRRDLFVFSCHQTPSPNHRVARSVGPSRHLRDCFGRLLRATALSLVGKCLTIVGAANRQFGYGNDGMVRIVDIARPENGHVGMFGKYPTSPHVRPE